MRACPICGTENPDRAKFCLECASRLTQPTVRPAEERKVVTVLFCDLVGFTAASDSADPEDVRARIRPYHRRLRLEIERYGGTVEKFIGDAVMAVFGAPVTHEDDAERAVRAGLRILESIDEMNAQTVGLELAVRVGIATGEVVVALDSRPEQGEGIVTGDVVNTASRLQGAAPAGAVVAGETTWAATADVFDWDALDPVEVKGKAEPVAIYRALAARARFGADMRTHETPLVGRDVEVSLVRSLFERSVRDTSVQLLTIVGEPGVGKTRLVWELETFIDEYPDLVAWRQGRCLPYGDGIVFWALGEIVKADAGILESDAAEVAAAKLDRAVGDDEPDRDWLLARLASLVGAEGGGSAEHEELFAAWRRYLEGIAATRPAVFVFEDVHWADPALLAFLRHVAEWSDGVAMTLVCTARPELLDRHPDWAGGTRNATTINLAPLSEHETAALIGALLDRTLLPAEVQRPIVERSGGNPLYAEEYVRMLRDRGLLVRAGSSWALAQGAEPPLPESVQALVAARLDMLPAERKMLLQDAAVLGKVFWAGAVAAMGGLDEPAVREALHELSRRDLVRMSRTSTMEGETEHAFTHLVIRDVAYSQIPRPARSAKHRAAAHWIEAKAGERAEDLADVLAYHTTQALDLAESAGLVSDTEALRGSARRYLVLAGDRALSLDVGRARELFDRALSLTDRGDEGRARTLERFAKAAHVTSNLTRAEEALAEAAELWRAAGDRRSEGRVALALAQVLMSGGAKRSEEQLRTAIELLEELGPSVDLRDAYGSKASQCYILGQEREAIGWADRAIGLATSAGLEESARALAVRGGSRATLGEAEGLDDVRRAIELARAHDDSWELTRTLNNFALDVYPHEGPAASLAMAEEAVAIAERRGLASGVRRAVGALLDAWYALGRWDELRARVETLFANEALEDIEEFFLLSSLLDVRAHRGEAHLLADSAERLVATAREVNEGQLQVSALAVGALVASLAHEPATARDRLEQLATSPDARASWNYVVFLPNAVRSAARLRDPELAQRLIGEVRTLTRLHENALLGAAAAIEECRGEAERAEARYLDAAARWREFGNVPETGFAELGRGRCLLVLGRTDDGVAALSRARAIFEALRATPYVAEIDATLVGTAPVASDVV